jgi:hypothetical protein
MPKPGVSTTMPPQLHGCLRGLVWTTIRNLPGGVGILVLRRLGGGESSPGKVFLSD